VIPSAAASVSDSLTHLVVPWGTIPANSPASTNGSRRVGNGERLQFLGCGGFGSSLGCNRFGGIFDCDGSGSIEGAHNFPHGVRLLLDMSAESIVLEQVVEMTRLQLCRKIDKSWVICHLGVQGLEKFEDLVNVLQISRNFGDVFVCLCTSSRLQVLVGCYVDIEPVAPRLIKLEVGLSVALVDVAKHVVHRFRVVLLEFDDGQVPFLNWRLSLATDADSYAVDSMYSELNSDSASPLEILIVCAENKFVDVDLAAIAELNRQIRVVRVVVPSACVIISIVP
jgi:hypothetical protein